MTDSEFRKTVVVTGFGPFGCHTINASWEAVRLMPDMFKSDEFDVDLVTEEIPVEYDHTLERIQRLWEKHRPLLMVHVGVSQKAKQLTLESCASKAGYKLPDVKGKIPSHQECCIGGNPQVRTKFNVEKLAADFNELNIDVTCCTSEDAGLYLCEFSFYSSLCVSGQQSLFVHVPDISRPYKSEETARGLCEILRLAIIQLNEDCKQQKM